MENINSINTQFDITKYLTHEQMVTIAEKVFEERLFSHVDQILENRTGLGGSIIDQILRATVERYVDKLESTFEEDFLKVCKEEIYRDQPPKNHEMWEIFRSGISYQLKRVAEKYIDNNSSEFQLLMKDTIRSQATTMAGDEFAYDISKRINIKELIRETLREEGL